MLIIYLIKIRFLQAFREIRDMGILRAVFLMAVIVPLLALFIYRRLPVPGYSYAVPGVALLVVFMIHRGRKDYFFLSRLSNPVWIFFAEYLVFSVPLLVLQVAFAQYAQVLIYAALLLCICLVEPSPKGIRTYDVWVRYIPAGMFEWRSGIRMSLPGIIPFYATGLAGVYSIWPSAASIILLSLTFGTFYGANESQKMLAASESGAGDFLRCKIRQHVKYWMLFLLPLFAVALVHYQYLFHILAAFAATVNLLVFAILAKYAFYRPASTVGLSQIITSIAWLCSILLPLSILVFTVNIVLYFKAKHNLNYYLHAYD
jgi:hypothetical protein